MKKNQGKLFKSRKVILEMRNREAANQRAFILFSPSQAVRQSTALQMKGRKRDFCPRGEGVR